jgi:hypothetical protein
MEAQRFDHLARHLSRATARRRLLAGLALSPFAGLVARSADDIAAKKKHKKKRKPKKPKPNAYGCLNAGQACGGDSALCCSGVCEGSKPKKGKKDSSRCVAHDAGICKVEMDECTAGREAICHIANPSCQCFRTTGNAAFCGENLGLLNLCRDCSQDADCEVEFGPGAACIALGGICEPVCPDTGGTACMPVCSGPAK